MFRPTLSSTRNYALDKAVDVALYLIIDALSFYFSYHTFSLSSLPPDSLLLVFAVVGVIALILTFMVAAPIHKKIEERRSSEASKSGETRASPRYVESGTAIIPKSGEPLIVTSSLLAGLEFFPSREALNAAKPSFNDLLKSAKKSIDVLAISAESIIITYGDTVRQLIDDGVHVRFIVLNPESPQVEAYAKAVHRGEETKTRIATALSTITKMKDDLTDLNRGYLDIRTHDLVPLHTVVVIDEAVMNVEFYVYGVSSHSWISVRIYEKQQPELFSRFWKEFRFVHDRSKTYGGGTVKSYSG
jgi:hypothetical protein